ncbi:F-box/FBD/LRR-repeat protein At1g13570-like [Pistacia vera]|uniref:F-box/FBD/LRR-repeat protein At1g13570-like n=1 Tax=Pistacia vera TaxID=55513 RepID=UPI00126364A6|nr:F-box/FBD/LRR-repeat protein At1g13570-like [Pistacia vera]
MNRERDNMDSDCNCISQPTEKEIEEANVEDFFWKLPDDILEKILSLLTIEEAASTSVLSSRWRYLWTFFSGCLDFNGRHKMMRFKSTTCEVLCRDSQRFVSWIDRVLGSLKYPTIEELRIRLEVVSHSDIDNWIKIALEKRVQRLELDLFKGRICHCSKFDCYEKCKAYNFALQFDSVSNFGSLTSLRLRCVDVTNEVLEHLLSSCPFLEVLSVEDTQYLTSFRISGPSLKLKHLQFSGCTKLMNLEICARNLISFSYFGPKTNVSYGNVENLSEVSFGGPYLSYVIRDLHQLSSLFMQLQTLKLNLVNLTVLGKFLGKIPALPNLKHLKMTIGVADKRYLIHCSAFLKASPSLYKFTLETIFVGCPNGLDWNFKDHPCVGLRDLNLRVFEFIGFTGFPPYFEFVMCLICTAKLLEKIIIHPPKRCQPELYQFGRDRAIQLRAMFPHLEFVIL